MPRLPRLFLPGVAQHIVQRGNNRQACFCSDEDCAACAYWLREAALKYGVAIHAWVFMTNHVHLLVTPHKPDSASLMMQHLGRLYVRYFNREYRRSGTLWEGRYKSCFVQDDHYLLMCYRYVELNPVRAAMVDDPPDYRWSSYHANTLGKAAVMRTPHSEYLRLGGTKVERQVANRGLFRYQVDAPLLTEVRLALNQGLVLGNERFKDEVESMLGKRMRPARVGRPRRDRESSADGGAGKQSKTLF